MVEHMASMRRTLDSNSMKETEEDKTEKTKEASKAGREGKRIKDFSLKSKYIRTGGKCN